MKKDEDDPWLRSISLTNSRLFFLSWIPLPPLLSKFPYRVSPLFLLGFSFFAGGHAKVTHSPAPPLTLPTARGREPTPSILGRACTWLTVISMQGKERKKKGILSFCFSPRTKNASKFSSISRGRKNRIKAQSLEGRGREDNLTCTAIRKIIRGRRRKNFLPLKRRSRLMQE